MKWGELTEAGRKRIEYLEIYDVLKYLTNQISSIQFNDENPDDNVIVLTKNPHYIDESSRCAFEKQLERWENGDVID